MALSDIVKTNYDGLVELEDGTTGTALTVALDLDKGDFAVTGLAADLHEMVAIVCRHQLRTLRHGAPTFPEIAFSGVVAETSEATVGTAQDMVQGMGAHAARVSTLGTTRREITLNVKWTIQASLHGETDEVWEFTDVHLVWNSSEAADGNKVAYKGKVYGVVKLNGTIIAERLAAA